MQTTYLFIFLALPEGIISLSVITQPKLYVKVDSNASIVLNCTYVTEKSESVTYIQWKKRNGRDFIKLAEFYPDKIAVLFKNGDYLKNRSELINPVNGSTSAVLKIHDVRCEDVRLYQCSVQYLQDGSTEATQNTDVFFEVDAESPFNFTMHPNNSTAENDTVTLSCYANAGNPDGRVAIWRVNNASDTPVLLNETNSVGNQMENCTTIIGVTATYTVSRNDNGALFRCSSQNRKGRAPSRDTRVIEVFYGPSNVRISPSKLNFVTGSNVNLTCSSDGRPAPSFTWKFNSSDNKTNEMYTGNMLPLHNINLNHSGIYVCMASNTFNGKTMTGSLSVTLTVQEGEKQSGTVNKSTCDANPCGITESCSEADGKASCATNTWSVVALVFIVLSLIFMVTTVILCIERRIVKKNSKNVDIPLPLMEGDDFGGYADPMDVKKINGQFENQVSNTEEHGDPVDQTSQYASVQKSTSPPDASNPPNVYDGAWN